MGAAEPPAKHPLLVWAWSLLRLGFVGVAFGALFFCLSLTPSLLPRDWVFQGLIGGINAAFGYGLGVLIGATVERFLLRGASWWPPPRPALLALKATVVVTAPTACVLMLIPAAGWQRQVSELLGIEGPATLGYLRTLGVAIGVAAALVATVRVLIDASRLLARALIRRWHLHREVAMFIGSAIVVVLLTTLINGVLIRGFFAGASAVFQPEDSATVAGTIQPLQPERSGSPESLAPWATLGSQGRSFVAGECTPPSSAGSTDGPPANPSGCMPGCTAPVTTRGECSCCSTNWTAPTPSIARCWWWCPPRAPGGWIRPRPMRWRCSTTATPRSSASSTPTCRVGSPSWPTNANRWIRDGCWCAPSPSGGVAFQ